MRQLILFVDLGMENKLSSDRVRIAYLVSHPIQYQAPLLRKIARDPGLDLTVFFLSDISLGTFKDKGFGQEIHWDVPLLDGYRHVFLRTLVNRRRLSFFFPFAYGLRAYLKVGRFDVLWVHGYSHLSHVLAIGVAKTLGIKVLMRGESNLISAHRTRLKTILKRLFLPQLFRLCDGFLCVGKLNREYYSHYGVPPKALFDMPYAVDNEFFSHRIAESAVTRESLADSLGLEAGRPIILYVSKLIARKHPMDLLKAYIQLSPDISREPRPYLLFIGSGEEMKSLEDCARETGWKSIRFLGFRNQSELPAFFHLCDAFVLPSTHEPWGLVINEVMNAAKPIIVSDQVGCWPDLVDDGINGYVYRARDIHGLSDALRKVIENPAKAKEMGQRSAERITGWNFAKDIQGLNKAINAVMRRPGSSQPSADNVIKPV